MSLHGEGETASRLRPRDVICIGDTGCGKSYLAAALAQAACRRGHSALFTRVQRLLQELSVARADGSYTKQLVRLDELQVLVLDDFLLAPLKNPERRDLLEILEDRYDRSSTVIMSQLPTVKWHAALSDPTVHNAHVLPLVPGRKSDTLTGWKRGGNVPPLPVQRATVVLTRDGGASDGDFLRSARTNGDGRVWVEALTDGRWELDLQPDKDELSPGPALPTALRDHGVDWDMAVDDGVRRRVDRIMEKDERLKEVGPWEVEYRPLKLELEVVGAKIEEVRMLTPAAPGRPDHAVVFWRDVAPDAKDQEHKKKTKGPLVSQVLEIDLKPDFMRRLFDEEDKELEPWLRKSRVRPFIRRREAVAKPGGDDASERQPRIRLFQVHHTAGDLIGAALNTFTAVKKKDKKGNWIVNKTGIHFVNDRDGHVVRMVDDHFFTQHGGGAAKLVAAWDDRERINDQAIGVENVEKKLGFTDAQLTSLKSLIREAMALYDIPAKNVIGHGDVYTGKAKTCPGVDFPWLELEAAGLAVFPIPLTNFQQDVMFGGFFAQLQGEERLLREGDRDRQDGDGTWSLLRNGTVIASGLTQGPVHALHEYLHAIGYVPNRREEVREGKKSWQVAAWERYRGSDAAHAFGAVMTDNLSLFRGRCAGGGRISSKHDNVVDRELAGVIYGAFLFVAGS